MYEAVRFILEEIPAPCHCFTAGEAGPLATIDQRVGIRKAEGRLELSIFSSMALCSCKLSLLVGLTNCRIDKRDNFIEAMHIASAGCRTKTDGRILTEHLPSGNRQVR